MQSVLRVLDAGGSSDERLGEGLGGREAAAAWLANSALCQLQKAGGSAATATAVLALAPVGLRSPQARALAAFLAPNS